MAPLSDPLPPIVKRFVESAGRMTQSFGLGRSLGQIFAFLYFSREPRNLGQMQQALGISKGNASTNVRQLEQWGAVRKVWVRGDRKDYYQASDWLGHILKNAVLDTVGKKMSSYGNLLSQIDAEIGTAKSSDSRFVRERIEHLRKFQRKAQAVWSDPMVELLMK
jgi:DNA-binding transcriptional regulator GbsR (MarR family)